MVQLLGSSPRICGPIKIGGKSWLSFQRCFSADSVEANLTIFSFSADQSFSCSMKQWKPHHSALKAVSHTFTSPLNISSALSVTVERLECKKLKSLQHPLVSLWERVWIGPWPLRPAAHMYDLKLELQWQYLACCLYAHISGLSPAHTVRFWPRFGRLRQI